MLITETLLKGLPKFYILLCVCVLMARINPFIAVALKSKLLEGYCNACVRWPQFSCCHRGGVCTRLGPTIAACSYILLLL